MSPPKKKTSARHAKAKRAARRSGRRARARAGKAEPRRTPKRKDAAQRATKRNVAAPRSKQRGTPRATKHAGAARPPSLTLVVKPAEPRPAQASAPLGITEFEGAKANASARDIALFEMERARIAVFAAIQGLTAGSADQPVAPGKWSPRRIVLHLAFWDREILHKYVEPAAARNHRAQIRRAELDAINAGGLAPLDHLDWDAAKRLLQTTREQLWEAFESIPAEPAETWSPAHAVGELVEELVKHDRHHAEIIKRWRADAGA
jgi:hypothetical protein